MKHIKLFEQWIPKLSTEPVPISKVGSFGQRITDNGKKKIKKQDVIVATDKTIHQIVRDEMERLGKDADLNHIDVSRVTNMNRLFELTNFRGDISEWDVSRVKDMGYMFYNCPKFNCDISGWDVRKVEDMDHMFYECADFNQDLSEWNVRKVKVMRSMFSHCEKFDQDLSRWKVGQVEHKLYMFVRCPIRDEFQPNF